MSVRKRSQESDVCENGFTIEGDELDSALGHPARTKIGQLLSDHRIIHMGRPQAELG